MALAQIISIVGSGVLAQQTTGYLGNGDTSKAAWLSMSMTIFTLAFNPPLSQAADYWGRKWIILTTALGGFAGAIIISRAQNVSALIAGFCVLGLSFGGQALFYTVVSEIVPRRFRAAAQATINLTSGLGGIIALLMGGGLLKNSEYGNYRIYWYVVAGLFFFSIAGVAVCYNPPPRQLESSLSTKQKLASLDWVGAFLLTGGLTTMAMALQWSDNPYKWGDAAPHVIAPFVVAVVLLVLFGVYEWKIKKDGLLHHSLFGDRNFVISLITIFTEGLAYFTSNSYYAFEVQVLTQKNLFDAGLRYSIMFFSAGAFSVAVGAYTTWTRQLREPLIFGFVLLTVFNVLMSTITENTPQNVFWGYPVVCGMGIGVLLTNLTVITQMSTPPAMVAITTGILTATRSLGATVALAINSAIFNDAISSNVPTKLADEVIPLGYPPEQLGLLIQAFMSGDQTAIQSIPDATPQLLGAAGAAMQSAYAASFRRVWICAAAFSAAGLVGMYHILVQLLSAFTNSIQ
jgi:MFS family permease